MESGGKRAFLFRLLAEFLAIFAGAVLALSADGWADRRSEEQEARAGLELVQSDLEADSAQFGPVRSTMSRWMRDAAWLIASWDRRDLPADSVALVFDSFTRSEASLHFNRSGFDGLRDANRLRLIDDLTEVGSIGV